MELLYHLSYNGALTHPKYTKVTIFSIALPPRAAQFMNIFSRVFSAQFKVPVCRVEDETRAW